MEGSTSQTAVRVLAAAMERAGTLPPPNRLGFDPTTDIVDYDDFQYVDCPYDDYQDNDWG